MRRMRTSSKTRKLGCPFPLCVTSELGTKCIDERLSRREGIDNDSLQAYIKAEYEKPKRKVCHHVNQLLKHDEIFQDYFTLFDKNKDRIIIEIPVDNSYDKNV